MNKEQLRARFERNLNGHFDVEKDEDGEYTNFNTVNMFSSFLVGAAVARADAIEQAAKACEDYMKDCLDNRDIQKHWQSIKRDNDKYAALIRDLINKEKAQ